MTVLSFPTGVPTQICRDHFGPGWIWRCQTAVDTTEKKLVRALNQGISALVLIPVLMLLAAYLLIRKKYRISEEEYDRMVGEMKAGS